MKTIIEQINSLRKELIDELKNVSMVLVTPEQMEDVDGVTLYEVPRTFRVAKYDFYIEYAILENQGGVLKCLDMSEGSDGNTVEFELGELSLDQLIWLAEFIEEETKENKNENTG